MFTNKEIVEKIRELSKKKDTSLTDMEKKFGWSNGRIGKWKNAKKRPPKQDLELIAKELEVSIETIIGAQKETPPPKTGDGIMPPKEYADLNAINKSIVDRLIADLAKSQLENPLSGDSQE